MLSIEFIASAGRFLDGLVHPCAAADSLMRSQHRAFIAANLTAGALALFVLPLHLAFTGGISLPQALAFARLAGQMPIAMYLSYSGKLETAHALSAALFSCFIDWMAFVTGGLDSIALVWLAIVPLEAALSRSRKVIELATLSAVAIAAALLIARNAGITAGAFSANWASDQVKTLAIMGGLFYALLVAFRVEWSSTSADDVASKREARYWLVADNVSDVITLHSEDGDTLFATLSIRTLLDLSVQEATGDGLFQRVHVADRPAFLTTLNDVARQKVAKSFQFRARRGPSKPGESDQSSYVWLEMRCRPMGYQEIVDGEAAVVAVTRDITRYKTHEEEPEDAQHEAEAASAAKMRFPANVSHELRTPLNAIICFSDILREFTPEQLPPERQREYVDLIHDSGQHLLQVVNDILDMSKIEIGNFELCVEPFLPARCISECVDMMRQQAANRDVTIHLDVPESLPELAGDRRACKQTFINLISNAIKFTRSGGSVTVSAKRHGSFIDIQVRDTGVGIAPDDLIRLGTPFLQIDNGYDRRHEGTGLGLSVVKGLVALHHGEVHFDSTVGVGTCVSVRLPAHTPGPDVRELPTTKNAADARTMVA
ncbi:PAS domain-containing sensor histidine kinase [Breoghania sp.]|uniref:sensor histidine kinase n=1 Tax=Breoghania sp. TaxID=2065378 RepID=UPI00262BBEAA|nr:PAS domain-containing sensor histidine kinase [Breoghania sp.]